MSKKINVKAHFATRDGEIFQLVRLSNAVAVKLHVGAKPKEIGVGSFCSKAEANSVTCDFTVTFTK